MLKAKTDAAEGEDDAEMQQKIQEEVDAAIQEAVADEDKMMAYIREHASTNLLKAVDGVQDPAFADDASRDAGGNVGSFTDTPSDGNNEKELSVGQVVGCALIGVMAAGLLATGFVLYKRRQYQRRQGVELSDDSDDGKTREIDPAATADNNSDDANGNANRTLSGTRLIPFGGKSPSGGEATNDDLSSSSEDYGLDEGARDDDTIDTFGKELQEAATVDKRAWEELDGLRDVSTP
jgi:hypothetical protein